MVQLLPKTNAQFNGLGIIKAVLTLSVCPCRGDQ